MEQNAWPVSMFAIGANTVVAADPEMLRLYGQIERLARTQLPILIGGESGVGKEHAALAVHAWSTRAHGPFVTLHCAALQDALLEGELFGYERGAFSGAVVARPGLFEAAHQGTVFLDEIGELPLALQAKLLRVLETGEVQRIGATETKIVKPRLVTATNRELDKEVEANRFREDLYYRIHVYPVHVPPLRERAEDIAPIVTHHLSTIARRENRSSLRLTADAIEKLVAYTWPGNVRELMNTLERAVLVAPENVIDGEHITFASATVPKPIAMPIAYREAEVRGRVLHAAPADLERQHLARREARTEDAQGDLRRAGEGRA